MEKFLDWARNKYPDVMNSVSRNFVHGAARHPWVQGQIERLNCTIQELMRGLLKTHHTTDWVPLLPKVRQIYMARTHYSIRVTPFLANYFYIPPDSWDGNYIASHPPIDPEYKQRVIQKKKDNSAKQHRFPSWRRSPCLPPAKTRLKGKKKNLNIRLLSMRKWREYIG